MTCVSPGLPPTGQPPRQNNTCANEELRGVVMRGAIVLAHGFDVLHWVKDHRAKHDHPDSDLLLHGHRHPEALFRSDQVVLIVFLQIDLDPVDRAAKGVA